MNKWLLITAVVAGLLLPPLVHTAAAASLPLAGRAGDLLVFQVDTGLAQAIASAQDLKGTTFRISLDGAPSEALDVAPERLRDYQNVYYRVSGAPGAWKLAEQAFSATGEDAESRLIREALGVPADKKVFFLPGRQHLVVPARGAVTLEASQPAGSRWVFDANKPKIAVLLRAGQPVALALGEAVSTASLKAGAAVPVVVAEDVVAEGAVAIPSGTAVEATVAQVLHPDFLGGPARLVIDLGSAKAADGTPIPLAAGKGARVAFEGRAGCPFFHASNLQLPAGTRFAAQVGKTGAVLAPAP